MKERLSRKQMFFNKINLTKDDKIYIGIDVHKKSYSVAIWLNDAPEIDFVMLSDNKKLVQMLKKIQIAVKNIVYEAGPTGYSLARELKKASLPVHVVAPSITPRPAAKHSKTDRLDCRTLETPVLAMLPSFSYLSGYFLWAKPLSAAQKSSLPLYLSRKSMSRVF